MGNFGKGGVGMKQFHKPFTYVGKVIGGSLDLAFVVPLEILTERILNFFHKPKTLEPQKIIRVHIQ